MISEQTDASNARMGKVLDLLESKISKSEHNPIHGRLGMMADITSYMATCAGDMDLSPNSKKGLLAALVSEKKRLTSEIIEISKKRSKNN